MAAAGRSATPADATNRAKSRIVFTGCSPPSIDLVVPRRAFRGDESTACWLSAPALRRERFPALAAASARSASADGAAPIAVTPAAAPALLPVLSPVPLPPS